MPKKISYILFSIFLSLALNSFATNSAEGNSEKTRPVAVVELFTSEGCSSCPPADNYLSELTKLAYTQNKNIITLSYHVDYWNYLGWTDPYSNSKFTRRQRRYAKILKSSTIYTPQIIVNGTAASGGNRRATIKRNIDHALTKTPEASITLSAISERPNAITFNYSLANAPIGSYLHFVVTERGLSNNVIKGENRGRTLKHDNVVRIFQTRKINKLNGQINVDKPTTWAPQRMSIIAFIQDPNSMHILGAKEMRGTDIQF